MCYKLDKAPVLYDCSSSVLSTCSRHYAHISFKMWWLKERIKLVTAAWLELSDYLGRKSLNNNKLHLMSKVSLPWPVMAHLIPRLMESHLPEPHGAGEMSRQPCLCLAHAEAASLTRNWVVVISTTLEPSEQGHGQSDRSSLTRWEDNYWRKKMARVSSDKIKEREKPRCLNMYEWYILGCAC